MVKLKIIRYQRIKNGKVTLVETDSEEEAVVGLELVVEGRGVFWGFWRGRLGLGYRGEGD